MTKISIIIRIALAVVLFILGAYIYGKFITWYLINKRGFKFAAVSVSWQFRHILLFSLCLAFVPISSLLV